MWLEERKKNLSQVFRLLLLRTRDIKYILITELHKQLHRFFNHEIKKKCL